MANRESLYVRIRDPVLAYNIKRFALEKGLDYQALVSIILTEWLEKQP